MIDYPDRRASPLSTTLTLSPCIDGYSKRLDTETTMYHPETEDREKLLLDSGFDQQPLDPKYSILTAMSGQHITPYATHQSPLFGTCQSPPSC